METENRSWRGLGRSGLGILGALAALLVLIALAIGLSTRRQQDSRLEQLQHSDAMIALDSVAAAMLDAETSQRGYLLTGKDEYLAPYRQAADRLGLAMRAARNASLATPDDGTKRRALDELRTETQSKIVELAATIDLMRQGRQDEALAVVRSDIGKRSMDRIRLLLETVKHAESAGRLSAIARARTAEMRLPWLMAVLSAAILAIVFFALTSESRRVVAEHRAAQTEALRAANERAELLARELNHRVKNLFSVILSVISLSSRQRPEGAALAEDIRARIHGLSLAHATSQGEQGSGGQLGDLVARILSPYSDASGERVAMAGPDIALPSKSITPIGLILHELATNAAKYGALSPEGKRLDIRWERIASGDDAGKIALSWNELMREELKGRASPPSHEGFGTRLTTLAARQLSGTVERNWGSHGLQVRLVFAG